MEELTAVVLNKKFGNIITPDAFIRVPWGWHMLVDKMLQRLHDLPTDIRAFLIIQGVAIGRDGMLTVSIAAVVDALEEEQWSTVKAIIAEAQTSAAWTCVSHGDQAGWIVRPPKGMPRPLCPECQERYHIKECARA